LNDEAFRARVLKDALQTKNLGDLGARRRRGACALALALAYLREISPVLENALVVAAARIPPQDDDSRRLNPAHARNSGERRG
jgi:hypothetical protein